MSRKNETPVLVISLFLTAGLLAGGYWWLSRTSSGNFLGSLLGTGQAPSDPPSPSPNTDAEVTDSPTTPATASLTSPGAEFTEVAGVPSGLFNYGGSTTWAPIRGQIDPVIQQAHPTLQLRYTDPINAPPGSGSGIEMLLNQQLSFAQSSRPLNPEERQRAAQQGYGLKEIPVALEGLVIAVHPDLPVPGITVEQLRDIYLGTLTNWQQVGGPDLPIRPVSRPLEGGTVEFFLETVLGQQTLPTTITVINTTTAALRFVSMTPGAIYYASAPEIVGQCTVKPLPLGRQAGQHVAPYAAPYVPPEQCPAQRNQINVEALRQGDYPLTRRLFVIVRVDGQSDQQAGEAYASLLLTQQGQRLLQTLGFVPIR